MRNLTTTLLFLLALTATAAGRAKYVFYFITDGTGVNTVLGTEMLRAARHGQIGRDALCMTGLPVVGVASTFSASSPVTDSAASGTALATGTKTQNGSLGVKPDLATPVTSVALWAKQAGMRVGVATSVTVNHATPAAFYAHRADRRDYYNIATDMLSADLDFYGGSAVNTPDGPQGNIYTLMRKAGYTIAYGAADYAKKAKKARKVLLVQDTTRLNPASGLLSLPYAIDRREGEMGIDDVLRCELDFLMKDNSRGFLLMNEIGGKVDWACHGHDAAAAFAEVEAVDRCMAIALDFYRQHPDETLIVLTADHETGGLVLARGGIYDLKLATLSRQRVSTDAFTATLHALRAATHNSVSWSQAKEALLDAFSFSDSATTGRADTLLLIAQEWQTLRTVWHESFEGKAEEVKNEYTANEPLAEAARQIVNDRALLSWSTGGHSAGLVPVYAIGPGSELFMGHNDNAEIPRKIAVAAGLSVKP